MLIYIRIILITGAPQVRQQEKNPKSRMSVYERNIGCKYLKNRAFALPLSCLVQY